MYQHNTFTPIVINFNNYNKCNNLKPCSNINKYHLELHNVNKYLDTVAVNDNLFADLIEYEYKEIPATKYVSNDRIRFRLDNLNVVSNLVILISKDMSKDISQKDDIFESIEIEGGGARLDKIYPKSMHITNWLYNSTNKYTDDYIHEYIHVPLSFYLTTKKLPLFALKYHSIDININFHDKLYDRKLLEGVKLYGNVYNVDQLYMDNFNYKDIEYKIVQTQFTGTECITKKCNKYRMDFKLPIFMLCIYNTSSCLITSIKLDLDGTEYKVDNLNNCDTNLFENNPIIITFDKLDKVNIFNNKTINGNCIDRFTLIVEIDDETKITDNNVLYIFAFNYNSAKYCIKKGMVDIKF